MGTYIKNFAPPKNCADCDDDMLRTAIGCPLFAGNGRHEKCPLIEAETPHGRLIDANKAKIAFAAAILGEAKENGLPIRATAYEVGTVINGVPTVIESED